MGVLDNRIDTCKPACSAAHIFFEQEAGGPSWRFAEKGFVAAREADASRTARTSGRVNRSSRPVRREACDPGSGSSRRPCPAENNGFDSSFAGLD
jgi:hypothetical protein